jgi:hypothetical protein
VTNASPQETLTRTTSNNSTSGVVSHVILNMSQ